MLEIRQVEKFLTLGKMFIISLIVLAKQVLLAILSIEIKQLQIQDQDIKTLDLLNPLRLQLETQIVAELTNTTRLQIQM